MKKETKHFVDERKVLADTPHEGGDGHGGSDNRGGSGGGCTPERPRPDPRPSTGGGGVRGIGKIKDLDC